MYTILNSSPLNSTIVQFSKWVYYCNSKVKFIVCVLPSSMREGSPFVGGHMGLNILIQAETSQEG